MSSNAPPDPGGYLENPTIIGSLLGMRPHWVSDNGDDLWGPEAIDKFNQYASNPKSGGSEDPHAAPGPGGTDPHASARFQDPNSVDEEDARGPDGDEMPRFEDLPSYTIWGQILKRFG